VLSSVDFVALNLLGNPNIQASGRQVTIKVLPDESRGILSIVSVTQGKDGAVSITREGFVVYTPDTKKVEADNFTVTVQDIEGATVTKTISILGPCLGDSLINRWMNRF
jgi:predicted RNA-binding protein with TRAM domain